MTNPRLERIERALDRLTKAVMLDLIARPDVDNSVKVQAKSIVEEIEAKNGLKDAR